MLWATLLIAGPLLLAILVLAQHLEVIDVNFEVVLLLLHLVLSKHVYLRHIIVSGSQRLVCSASRVLLAACCICICAHCFSVVMEVKLQILNLRNKC